MIKQSGTKNIPNTYIDREISWLSFNDRVLQEAKDSTVPLIERIRFMGIFSNNLDEFYRVRVASLARIIEYSKTVRKPIPGYNPQKVLKQIKKIAIEQQQKFDNLYNKILISALAEEKIFIINEKQLNVTRGNFVKEYFREKVLPALVPVMIEKNKSFPFLKDRAIYLFIKLYNKDTPLKYKMALIELPTDIISRFLILPETNQLKFVILLEDVIRYCLEDIFSIFNYRDFEAYTIKLTRDAELDSDLDLSMNLIESLSKSLKQRKKGKPTRFVHDEGMPQDMLDFLIQKLNLIPDSIIPGGRYHNFKDFMDFPNVNRPDLEYSPIPPLEINNLNRAHSILAEISKRDYMLHLPYHSFDYIIRVLREAAIDPKVVSIKMTLYRVAKNSRIVNALINAVRNGKKVTVVLELKARFDEENNIYWNQKLTEEGVKVLHGVPGKKVHAKMCLVTRREKNKMQHYGILSTGNFNEKTARVYADHVLLTKETSITSEMVKVFSSLEKNTIRGEYTYLMVSPLDMRTKIYVLIENEIKHAQAGKASGIFIKLNSLADTKLIDLLYEASRAGVKIRMIIRGICCLIPGMKGLSENIEVISIVDKFLEHTRVFIFENNGKELMYVSSADWMIRNLDNRVEVAFPVLNADIRKEIKYLLDLQWKDNTKARKIDASQKNSYRVTRGENHRAQRDIYNYLRDHN